MPPEPALARYRVVIEQDEDGAFVADVPSLPGCVSQGSTSSEAVANVRLAIAGYLESLRARGEPVPPGSEEVMVDVS
jgi:predicted RNase H-like HicB family nuclease